MPDKKILFLAIGVYLLVAFQKIAGPGQGGMATEQAVQYYTENAEAFALHTGELTLAIRNLSGDSATWQKATARLIDCRLRYKKIEFFTAYFFSSETRLINAAPVYEVEEPTLELVEPMGLQQIEALLFDDNYLRHKSELILQAELLQNTASNLTALLYHFELTDAQLLESLRVDLIRVITLSISGYDAPELKTGIREAGVALSTLRDVLGFYQKRKNTPTAEALNHLMSRAVAYLDSHPDFDTFDRMTFLRLYALPLQTALSQAIGRWEADLPTTLRLHHRPGNLFDRGALPFDTADSTFPTEKAKRLLGKKLFSARALSGGGDRSCATCHQPARFFNDNLTRSAATHPDTLLKRNTPTLLYASAQHAQFWDGRAASMEEQIRQVIFNPLEMNGDPKRIAREIFNDNSYKELLHASFPAIENQNFTVQELAEALAAYLTTLQPFTSPFDRYIQGDLTALTDRQIQGFNLFMGKAQCGTCHFLPYFNSLLPPYFDRSEVEILGTPANANFEHPHKDSDRGRYEVYPIHYYEGAFKTPTVRNAAQTAPYMHNGALKTIAEVIEFYNRGGGTGLGLEVPDQTLSGKPLHLTPAEMEDLTLFIDSLTDTF